MESYKKFCLIFFATIPFFGLGFLALCALLWLYDPFMFFHKPFFREQTYIDDLRISARGIIDFVEFDSVILGSSVMENHSTQNANNKLGGKWVNLAIYSLSFNERELWLERLFKRKQIRQMIYSIEAFSLLNDNDKDMDSQRDKGNQLRRTNPTLYQYNFLFDLKYYLNKRVIKCAFKWSKKPECVGQKELPQFGAWYIENKNAFSGFESWSDATKSYIAKQIKYYQTNHFDLVPFEKQKLQDYIKRSVFRFAKANPHTNFHFIYPTHSRLLYLFPSKTWTKNRHPQQFLQDLQYMLKWFVEESAKYPNVKVYGFDDLDYADNLANYCDDTHYNLNMNKIQLEAIANGKHILTPQNIDSYLATMESNIKNYDLAPLLKQIKAQKAQMEQ